MGAGRAHGRCESFGRYLTALHGQARQNPIKDCLLPATATSSRRDAAARARAPPWGRAAPPRLPRRGPSHPRRGASPGRVHSRNFRDALSRSGPPRARRPARAQPAPRAAQDHGEERCPEEQVQERQAQEAAQGARSASRRRRPPPHRRAHPSRRVSRRRSGKPSMLRCWPCRLQWRNLASLDDRLRTPPRSVHCAVRAVPRHWGDARLTLWPRPAPFSRVVSEVTCRSLHDNDVGQHSCSGPMGQTCLWPAERRCIPRVTA